MVVQLVVLSRQGVEAAVFCSQSLASILRCLLFVAAEQCLVKSCSAVTAAVLER